MSLLKVADPPAERTRCPTRRSPSMKIITSGSGAGCAVSGKIVTDARQSHPNIRQIREGAAGIAVYLIVTHNTETKARVLPADAALLDLLRRNGRGLQK